MFVLVGHVGQSGGRIKEGKVSKCYGRTNNYLCAQRKTNGTNWADKEVSFPNW